MRLGRSLRFRGLLLLSILAAALIGISAFSARDVARVAHSGQDMKSAALRMSGPVFDLALALKQVQFDVVQVQQWLTDISATRGQDGLSDGFDKAAEFAKSFDADSAAAIEKARALGYDDLAARGRARARQLRSLLRDGTGDGEGLRGRRPRGRQPDDECVRHDGGGHHGRGRGRHRRRAPAGRSRPGGTDS